MIVRTFQNKRTTDLPYDMKVIHCYCPFKMHFSKINSIHCSFFYCGHPLCTRYMDKGRFS